MANEAEKDKGAREAGASKEKPAKQPRAPKAGADAPADAAPKAERPARKGAGAAAAVAGKPGAAPAAEGAAAPAHAAGTRRQERQARPASAAPAAGKPAMLKGRTRLEGRYTEQVVPALRREFGYTNVMQIPRLRRVSVNIGMGEALKSSAAIDAALIDVTTITGQKAVVTKSRKAIANFSLREGQPIGVMVTLRGPRMWQFMDRLMNITLPRVRDFRGVPRNSFDGRGNYSLGLKEQVVFPEIDYNKIDRIRGMQINFTTSARTDEEGRRLLELLGMPFVRVDQKN